MEIALFFAVGLLVGCLGAMLGIGGGVIVVPLMTFVFGASPQMAVGTSLLVVLFNSLSSAIGYLRKKMVCTDAAWKFGIATLPGALLGGYVSDLLQGKAFSVLFGLFFVLLGTNMFYKGTRKKTADSSTEEMPARYNWRLGTLLSGCIGFLSSVLGIGGGVFHVPMMTYLLRFPIRTAIATSSTILALSSVAGVLSHAAFGHVEWLPALCLGIGASVGAQFGVSLAAKAKTSLLMKGTALLVLAMGLKFLSVLF